MVNRTSAWTAVIALLATTHPVSVHGHDHSEAKVMDMASFTSSTASPATSDIGSLGSPIVSMTSVPVPSTYFSHSGFSPFILTHIGLMTMAWFFVLPVAVMLNVARSSLALAAQIGFFSLNGFGLLVGALYSGRTPILYENNLHHKLGWAVTWAVLAQIIIGLLRCGKGENKTEKAHREERLAFMPAGREHMTGYQRLQPGSIASMHRYSHDSAHGTESNTSSSDSTDFLREGKDEETPHVADQAPDHDIPYEANPQLLGSVKLFRRLSRMSQLLPYRIRKLLSLYYDAVDILILIIGFILILTGFVTYGGVFRHNNIFNGLAHSIKGGIFFWYGLLTLSRWMGCFASYGWAWNVRLSHRIVGARHAKVPSAEFVESFVIFLYGSTNIFLEHLAGWGDSWTAQDLEHVSISIMFFGGGLFGMLVESRKIRDLLNANLSQWDASGDQYSQKRRWTPPKTYSFSMNPFPALIILLLGLMMSSHHQHSMVSTMVHKQWGMLFVGFALARAVTYILIYLGPPSSYLPSRPPSEIVASFCLISGGLVFIASNKDTVAAMESHDLNAMFVFTVTMGLTAFLMAWEVIVLAIKGWAIGRRRLDCHAACRTLP